MNQHLPTHPTHPTHTSTPHTRPHTTRPHTHTPTQTHTPTHTTHTHNGQDKATLAALLARAKTDLEHSQSAREDLLMYNRQLERQIIGLKERNAALQVRPSPM